MLGHRIVYAAVLFSCGLFYIAYGEWLSAIVLLTVLGLPWLSGLLSLPALVTFRLRVHCPGLVQLGEEAAAWLEGSSRYPLPPFRGYLRLKHLGTGAQLDYSPHTGLPTEHCGAFQLTVEKPRVCDYLGLLSFPVRLREEHILLIRPQPVEIRNLPDLKRCLSGSWRPKSGGGFGENHELRPYRPGDSLNQIHWKLTAKTGSLTIREPMEPQPGLLLLTMTLSGTAEALDRKFGRLLWLGQYLLGQEASFHLRVLTDTGICSFSITGEQDLWQAIDTLLRSPQAREGSVRNQNYAASWQYHIGGEADDGA